MPDSRPDHTTKDSPWPVAETTERLTGLIADRGMTVFSTIDQRAAARRAGLELRETVLIVFGDPTAGTPVMEAEPLAALDLPLKLLVWDDDGRTRVSYLTPAVLAARFGLSESLAAPLAGIDQLTDAALAGAGTPAAHSVPASRYRTIELDDGEIFYREAGDRSAPPLLLLHGFPSSSAQYERLMHRLRPHAHMIAPDLPGFGRSPAPDGTMTFDRLADSIERFTEAVGLERYSLYMFDFGAPVGFRLAVRHPERVDGLVIQNGNAYEVGLGPRVQPLKAYWRDRAAHEDEVRGGALTLEGTRTQYVEGTPDPTAVNPDLWELDQRYLDMDGRDQVMLDLLYDYQSNLAAYPAWHEYLRSYRPPTLIAWGTGDQHFPPVGAHAYLADLPDAELHLLDTGHFATATHSDEIAELIADFLPRVD
jgi:pimeloyl-ACP methyl ester carboxylesterase/uncharacterized protein (DUF302 family)